MTRTRRERANALLEKLKAGPTLLGFDDQAAKETAEEQFILWLNSWITPEVKGLIPELQPPRYGARERKP